MSPRRHKCVKLKRLNVILMKLAFNFLLPPVKADTDHKPYDWVINLNFVLEVMQLSFDEILKIFLANW